MNLPMTEITAPLSGHQNGGVTGEQEQQASRPNLAHSALHSTEEYRLNPTSDNDCMRLELSSQTLRRLLTSGQLCAADFRCLDCTTKHCVWRLMASRCTHSLGCEGCCAQCDLVVQKTTVHQLKPRTVYGKF